MHVAARFLMVLGSLFVIGCGPGSSSAPVSSDVQLPGVGTVDVEAMSDIQLQQQELASAAREELFQRLSARLIEVLGEAGPSRAIVVCKSDAPRLAAEVGEEYGVTISRTSHRLRNPQNSAPPWAQHAVDQQVTEPSYFALDDAHLGVLLPIRMMPACVLCHGPKDEIVPEVRAALVSHYPEDQATGFREGDLRGWFWIDVPVPSG